MSVCLLAFWHYIVPQEDPRLKALGHRLKRIGLRLKAIGLGLKWLPRGCSLANHSKRLRLRLKRIGLRLKGIGLGLKGLGLCLKRLGLAPKIALQCLQKNPPKWTSRGRLAPENHPNLIPQKASRNYKSEPPERQTLHFQNRLDQRCSSTSGRQ